MKTLIKDQNTLRKALNNKMEHLSESEIFGSDAYLSLLTTMANGIIDKQRKIAVSFNMNEKGTAKTDGTSISVAFHSVYDEYLKTIEKRHRYYKGLILHEAGHILFSDFELLKELSESILTRNSLSTPVTCEFANEIKNLLNSGKLNYQIIRKIAHNIANLIEDSFIDRIACIKNPGYSENLYYTNYIAYHDFYRTYDEIVKDRTTKCEVFLDLLYMYTIFHVKPYTEKEILNDKTLELFEKALVYIDKGIYSTSPFIRIQCANEVLCYILHIFYDEAKDNTSEENPGSSQDSSTSNPANSEENDASDNAENPENSDGSEKKEESQSQSNPNTIDMFNDSLSTLPLPDFNFGEHTNPVKPVQYSLDNKQSDFHNMDFTEFSPSDFENENGENEELETIKKEIALDSIASEQESLSNHELNKLKVVDELHYHSCVPWKMFRLPLSQNGIYKYEKRHQRLDLIVRRFIKTFENEMVDKTLGDKTNKLYAGRLDSRQITRIDKRVFSQKKMPEDIPDISLGILIDSSGSMEGEKLEAAIDCAYITYQFCAHFGIPCFIWSHSTSGDEVCIYNIVDDNTLSPREKMRIFDIQATDCNRDGLPLRLAFQHIEKMDGESKLIFVISDGTPNHNGYLKFEGKYDCQAAVMKAKGKGISTITAGIDSVKSIHDIYIEDANPRYAAKFLDLSDLTKLPKAFVKILKATMMN